MLAGAALAAPATATTPLGTTVSNIAEMTYETESGPVTIRTAPAVFTVVAAPTPSEVEFYRLAPAAPDRLIVTVQPGEYAPSGFPEGPFAPVGPVFAPDGSVIPLPEALPLVRSDWYYSGDQVFVGVRDEGHNGDPQRIETLSLSLSSTTGDRIRLRLFETGPDTGWFVGYASTSTEPSPPDDPVLTTPSEATLEAAYQDPFNAEEATAATAILNPVGRVYDATTGDPLDGARVTLVDAATGAPAAVWGRDGLSDYPSSVVSGEPASDGSGRVYEIGAGQFLFPMVPPGRYRLIVDPPDRYVFPSLSRSTFGRSDRPNAVLGGAFGEPFELQTTGPVGLNLPVDPESRLVLDKATTTTLAAVGDFVAYTISVENRAASAAFVRLVDEPPRGFRYVNGSLRRDGQGLADTSVSDDGGRLVIDLGDLASGALIDLSYVLEVAPGTRNGEAENRVFAIDGAGETASNLASASIWIQEDLLRSRSTLIGRVVGGACGSGEPQGVAGARLYLETGRYVVTDPDGYYHFEDVAPGSHVVQLDAAALPDGYRAATCTADEDLPTSRLLDLAPGVTWRANFAVETVERTDPVASDTGMDAGFNDAAEHLGFDAAWLDRSERGFAWAYPDPARTPSAPSVNIGLAHPVDHSVELWLNGAKVPEMNRSGRDLSSDRTKALSRWRGVDIEDGENRFEARLLSPTGQTVQVLARSIWYVTEVARARVDADASRLVADGRTPPVVALALTNTGGRAVHSGRVVSVVVDPPYQLYLSEVIEAEAGLTRSLAANGGVAVGQDGLARVQLDPTLRTGVVTLRVRLDNDREDIVRAYLAPERRDWIVVGLVEGVVGQTDGGSGSAGLTGEDAADPFTDGRFAVYAKGPVGETLSLTLAIDTDKRRGDRDGDFRNEVDPNARYTLYGDRAIEDTDAPSRFPIFAKLENATGQALIGDFATDLNETELARYGRMLSGLKLVQETERFGLTAFAAETNQGFRKDEIAADGTSGPYRLSLRPVIPQSDTVTIEVRDRLRPDVTLSRRPLQRFLDYDIDYQTGELIFLAPVDAVDPGFNPQVIVVDYETSLDAERNLTAGGRAAIRFAGGAVEIGASLIHEEGATTARGAVGDLVGVDLTWAISETTEIEAEYARTESTSADQPDAATGEAVLLRMTRQTDRGAIAAHYREEQGAFGLGQQTTATAGVRRYGVDVQQTLSESDDAETGLRTVRSVTARALREEALATGASRSTVDATVKQGSTAFEAEVGVRGVTETFRDADDRQSTLLIAGVRRAFADIGLTLSARHEAPLGGQDESSANPQRTVVGLDKRLTEKATLNLRHELLEGANASGQNTTAGVTVQPWTGADIRMQLDALSRAGGRQLGASFGLDQAVQFNEVWSGSAGLARRAEIGGSGDPRSVAADAALSPLETTPVSPLTGMDGFTSAYAGVGYRKDNTAASARVETRDSAGETRHVLALAAARQAGEALSFGVSGRHEISQRPGAGDGERSDLRIGVARRPRDDGAVVFNRLDFKRATTPGIEDSWKLVNNLAVNVEPWAGGQGALFLGTKFTRATLLDEQFEGWTHLVGGEVRQEIGRGFDIGLSGSALWSQQSGTLEYALGPSVGYRPNADMWVSVGWNLEGFEDRDFEAAEFTRQGPYVKARVKFDQNSLRELVDRIGF